MSSKFFAWSMLLIVLLAPAGCAKPKPPATLAANAPLYFHPELKLSWPVTPRESCEEKDLPGGIHRMYHAVSQTGSRSGDVSLMANVVEYPAGKVKDAPTMINEYLFATNSDETSRKTISHGPDQLPGVEVTTRILSKYGRKLVVVAGNRIYELVATCPREKPLNQPEINAFFDSLQIKKTP